MTVMEFLEQKLQPQYVGWGDQFRAVLYALGIPPYADIRDIEEALTFFLGPVEDRL